MMNASRHLFRLSQSSTLDSIASLCSARLHEESRAKSRTLLRLKKKNGEKTLHSGRKYCTRRCRITSVRSAKCQTGFDCLIAIEESFLFCLFFFFFFFNITVNLVAVQVCSAIVREILSNVNVSNSERIEVSSGQETGESDLQSLTFINLLVKINNKVY